MVQFDSPWHLKSSVSSSFKVGWIPFSHYWLSGVIRIGLPVWRWKRSKIFRKWEVQSAANGPEWRPHALKPLCLIQFWSWRNSPFPLLAHWGNKNWPPSIKVKMMKQLPEQKWLKGMQMVQFECLRHWKLVVSFSLENGGITLFPIISPLG